ncbi:hypothetical protein M8C21_027659, partial [Ambrosia artemisiifolia]
MMGVGREEGRPHEVLTCAEQKPFNPSAPTQASSRYFQGLSSGFKLAPTDYGYWLQVNRMFPELYAISKYKRAKVCDNYSKQAGVLKWEWNWKRNPTSTVEMDQLGQLQNVLLHQNIMDIGDSLMWKSGDKLVTFSVAQVRKDMAENESIGDNSFQYKWSRLAVPK